MFLGHFAAAFAAKALAPRVSLGTLFLAAQFADLLWPTLLLTGMERARVVPGDTVVTPLAFDHYPVSHSLVSLLGWSVLLALAHFAFKRSVRGAAVVGALVMSHWVLDALVHRPDLPLYPGGHLLVGAGLWNSAPATLVLEVAALSAGAAVFVFRTRAADAIGRWALMALLGLLLAIYVANLLGPVPPDITAVAYAGHAQWLLVAWGYWIDAHRRPVQSGMA